MEGGGGQQQQPTYLLNIGEKASSKDGALMSMTVKALVLWAWDMKTWLHESLAETFLNTFFIKNNFLVQMAPFPDNDL